MNIHKYILRFANSLVNLIVIMIVFIVGSYCAYCLWDNQQIFVEAENVQEDMIKLKPEIVEEEGEAKISFEELLVINPDVCAWLTLDGTKIDYPVLQGENNLEYINKDVYGDFALAGSIYLDSRCDKEYRSKYSLLYGHYMAQRRMFGDLELYKDETFFDENNTGVLILPDRVYDLEIFCCMLVSENDDYIFTPDNWEYSIDDLLSYAEQNAMHLHKDILKNAREQKDTQILSMTTCSYEYEDARTIVLAVMKPHDTTN